MITVQAIHYTSHVEDWWHFAEALELTPAFAPTPDWSEFDASGVLAIHTAAPDAPAATDLHVLVDDLDEVEQRVRADGIAVERSILEGVGPMLIVRAASGVRVTASAGARRATHSSLAVLPIWYQDDLDEPARILEALGLRRRQWSESGTWIDFTADGGGSAALHWGESTGLTLGMEYAGDLDAFADRVRSRGCEASVIDEAYNRTLLVPTPDGTTLWINGPIDPYGYQRSEDLGR